MSKKTMSHEQASLPQLTAEMQRLYAALSNADTLTKEELQHLADKTYDFLGDFESDFGVRIPTLRPEVPEETRRLFVSLFNLLDKATAS